MLTSVAEPLIRANISLDINWSVKERNVTSVMDVVRSSIMSHTLHFIGEFLLERNCKECGNAFSVSPNLTYQVIRNGEKSYKCNEWGNVFSQISSLHSLQRIPTGEKPYKCSQCGKSFTQHSSFTRHQITLIGEKPYKCNEFSKVFSQNASLLSHWRIHFRK